MQVEQHWYTDIYRNVLWSIAKGILTLLDGFFAILNKIWRFEFFNNEFVNKIFSGALIVAGSWLALKVIIELIMNFIVKNDRNDSPVNVYRGICIAVVMMFLISPLFDFGHKVSTSLTESVISVSGIATNTSSESTISKALIRAMIYTDETKEEDVTYLVDNWKTLNINAIDEDGFTDYYHYSVNFFMLIILSGVTIFLLFFVAIQMAKRVMEIALFKIIGPFCCTSLTHNGRAFETWCKSAIGLFLITVVQFISIGLLLNMFGSAFKDDGTMAGLFLIIGALLFIIGTPTIINSLLGQQSGIMSAFGDIQSLMAISQGVNQGLYLAKSGVNSALSLGANVISSGNSSVSRGVNKISNMLNRNQNLNSEQMNIVQDSLSKGNAFKASQQTKDFLNQNNKRESVLKMDKSNPFLNPHSMRYNPIRNQYTNLSNMQFNNDKLDGGNE